MVVSLVVHVRVPAVRPRGRPMRVRGDRGDLVPPAPPARRALERVEPGARAPKVAGRGVKRARRVRRSGRIVRAHVRARACT